MGNTSMEETAAGTSLQSAICCTGFNDAELPMALKGDPHSPTEDARDLVAYLNVLGRSAMQSSSSTTSANTPATLISLRQDPQMPSDLEEGKAVFLANCSGCHGTDGTGHSPGGRALR